MLSGSHLGFGLDLSVRSAVSLTKIEGCYCPACGEDRLHRIEKTGELRCMSDRCTAPGAASELLSSRETEHIMSLDTREGTVIIKHPLRERIADDLFSCDVLGDVMKTLSGKFPKENGRYRITKPADEWVFKRLASG